MNLRRRLGAVAIAAGAAVVSIAAFAVTAPGYVDVGAARAPATGDSQKAAYSKYCIACHGVDGQGVDGLGVNLVASPYVASTPSAELVDFLKIGRLPNDPATVSGRPMPGFAYVDEAELAAIADYLKQRSNP